MWATQGPDHGPKVNRIRREREAGLEAKLRKGESKPPSATGPNACASHNSLPSTFSIRHSAPCLIYCSVDIKPNNSIIRRFR